MRLFVDVFFILLVSLNHGNSQLTFDGSNTCSAVISRLNTLGLSNVLHAIQWVIPGARSIEDGGRDMYNNGNYLALGWYESEYWNHSTRAFTPYLTGCQSNTVAGTTYSQDFVNYFQVTVVDEMQDDRFEVWGALGANGLGSTRSGAYETRGFYTFWKQVYGAGDPSVIHLWLTNAPNAQHGYSTNTNDDLDYLDGVEGYGVIYILFSNKYGSAWSTGFMQFVVDRVIMGLSDAPTQAPTKAPTTHCPSLEPSSTPSGTPSGTPSRSPSKTPSSMPSGTPSSAPTEDPTKAPVTSEPTLFPTMSTPTSSPTTSEPTFSPSTNPVTSEPTNIPTAAPWTSEPTQAPSVAPSTAPVTMEPTNIPTDLPTSAPSETLDYEYITFLNQFDDIIAHDDEVPQFLLDCSANLHETFNTQVDCDLIQSTAAGTAYIRIAGPTSQIPDIAQLINGFGMVIDGYPPLYTQVTGTPKPTTEAPTALMCGEDEVMVEVLVVASVSWAYDIKWSISDTCKNDVGYADGPSDGEPDVHHTTQCCLLPTTYTIECKTWFSSGWEDSKLAVNGVFYCDSIEQDEAHLLNLCPNGGDCTGISTTSMSTTPTIIIGTGGGSSSGGSTVVIPTTGGDDTTGTTGTDEGNSCFFAHDGECDEQWGCDPGTDCTDCGNCLDQVSGAPSFTVGVTGMAMLGLFLLL